MSADHVITRSFARSQQILRKEGTVLGLWDERRGGQMLRLGVQSDDIYPASMVPLKWRGANALVTVGI
jgi:hypothetical protein